MRLLLIAWATSACALAQDAPTQQQIEIQRALIERDRRTAEFSRPELRDAHAPQDMQHRPMRPDERALQARERDSVPQPRRATPPRADDRPLPLPGGPRHGVDPIPVQGVGG